MKKIDKLIQKVTGKSRVSPDDRKMAYFVGIFLVFFLTLIAAMCTTTF